MRAAVLASTSRSTRSGALAPSHIADHAAHRQAAELRALDAERVQQRRARRGRGRSIVYGPGGTAELAVAAAVVAQHAEALGEARRSAASHIASVVPSEFESTSDGRVLGPVELGSGCRVASASANGIRASPWLSRAAASARVDERARHAEILRRVEQPLELARRRAPR